MKRYTYYIGTVLLAFVFQTVQAQTEQDALYIFRNDGGFNAFFFDDIDHFEYSRIDTLGIEHDDYVVQEVYAMDSVFRIPITAIDSVAFVTPETEYKKDVIKANPQVSDFVVASDSLRWIRLSSNVPTNLLPKKGDKWLIEGNSALLPGGFGGRVTAVEDNGNGYTITTEALQPEEAFERVILKMAVGTQDLASTRTREVPLWGSEEPIELEAISGSASLTGSKDFINDLDIFSESISPLGSIKYYLKPTLHARSFLSVDPLAGVHVDGYIGADAEIEYAGKVSGTLTARLDLPFPHKLTWFRVVLGQEDTPVYAKVLWKCGLFVEGAGSMELEANYSGTYRTMASLNYYKPAFGSGKWSGDVDTGYDFDEYDVKKLTLGVSFSGGLMLEAAFECFNPLISGVSGIGLRAELGRSLSFKIPVTTISDNLPLTYYTDHIYDKLDIDDIVSYSPVILATPYSSIFGWQTALFERQKLFEVNAGVVPEIYDYVVDMDEENFIPGEGIASYKMKRNLILPVKVGLTVLDWKDDVVDSYWRPDTYWNSFSTKTVENNFILDPLADKETSYTIFPTVQMPGSNPILCAEPVEIILDPAYFFFPDYDEFVLPPEEGSLKLGSLEVDTNIPNVEVNTGVDWVTASWMPHIWSFVLHYKALPDELDSRQCKLHIVGKNKNGDILIEQDIPVTQKATEERIKFTVTPTTLDVPGYSKDFQNGSLTKQITVTYPKSATALTVTSSDDSWLKADNGGGIGSGSNTCTISIKANTSLKNSRQGTITIQLTKSDGSTVTKTVSVKQSAMSIKVEAKPDDITLEAQKDEESDVSDTKTVTIEITPYDDFIASLIKDQNVTSNAEWIHYSLNGSAIQIWADINPVDESRENTITYTLTLTTGDVITRTIKVTQLKLEGDPSVIDAGEFHFSCKEGDQTITISEPNVEKIINVDSFNDWIGVLGSGLKLTVTVKENPTPKVRIGVVKVTAKMKDGTEATLFYQVTQDAGAGFGEITSIDLYVKLSESTTYDDGETYIGTYERDATVSTDKGEITTSPKGSNGLHVVCTQTIDDWHLYNYTVTFDIDDIYGLQSRTANIVNLKFHLTEDDQSATEIIHGEEGISIPSIPMNGENQWGGTAGGGVEFNSFVDKYHSTTYNEEGEVSYSYSRSSKLVNSSDNTVRIKLNFR